MIPTKLNPGGGDYIAVAAAYTFTWVASAQAAYHIQYREQGGSITDVGWVTSTVSGHSFAAKTFLVGREYVWRVKVRNASLEESSYSGWEAFHGGEMPGVIITLPASDLDEVTESPTYQHEYANPYGRIQSSYRYRLYTGAKWDDIDALTLAEQEALTWDELELLGGEMKYDTGVLPGAATTHYQPPGHYEDGEDWYKVRCNIVNNESVGLESDLRTFKLALTDIPPTPTITVTSGDEAITVEFVNPVPGPGQPAADSNRVYRSTGNINFALLAEVTAPYVDHQCDSGRTYYYKVSGVASGVEGFLSDSASGVVNLAGYVLTDLVTGDSWTIEIGAELQPVTSERDRNEQVGLYETFPTVTYGKRRFYRGGMQGMLVVEDETSDDIVTQLNQFRAVIDGDTKRPLQLRTPAGETMMIDAYGFQYVLAAAHDRGRTVAFEFVQVGA